MAKKQKKQGFFNRMGQFFNQVVFGNRTTVSLSELASFSDWFNSQPEMYETIFGVVSRLSNTLASLPLHLYDKEYNEPTDCAAYNLMQLGPRYFNQFDLKRDWEALRNIDGNSYTHLIRDRNGNVIDMKLIKPKCCALYIDTNSGTLYYAVSAEDDNSAIQTLYVPYTDILHFKHMRYGSATGIGPVSLLSDTLNYDTQVRKISLSQLNGTNEGFIVKMAARLSEEEEKAQINHIAQFYKDNGGLLVQQAGVEITRIERQLVDTNLLNIDQVTRSRVAMVFGVPLHFLGVANSSYNSLEQLNMEFVTGNLMSTVTQYEEELNKKLLTPAQRDAGYHFEFDMNGLLRGDTATRTAYYQAAIRCSILKPNEIRLAEGYPPVDDPNADRLWISGDLYPIDTPIADRKAVAPAKGGE